MTKEKQGRLESVFVPSEGLNLAKACSAYDQVERKYILFVPQIADDDDTIGTSFYAGSGSRTFVYDITNDAWFEWSGMSMARGILVSEGYTYFVERLAPSTDPAGNTGYLCRRHVLDDAWAYQDNAAPISWRWATGWMSGSLYGVLSKFLDLRTFRLLTTPNSPNVITIKAQTNFDEETDQMSVDSTLPTGLVETRTRLFRGRVRSARLSFENSADQQNVCLSAWEVQMALPYKPRIQKP
jgi:hypothetical protein